jgi:hypothetical protein
MTNILQTSHRPWVLFDATNHEHRAHYAEFCSISSWGQCPVRFMYDPNYIDLLSHIQCELVKFYIAQEFKSKFKKKVVDTVA